MANLEFVRNNKNWIKIAQEKELILRQDLEDWVAELISDEKYSGAAVTIKQGFANVLTKRTLDNTIREFYSLRVKKEGNVYEFKFDFAPDFRPGSWPVEGRFAVTNID